MNSTIETLDNWGGYFLSFAGPMLWQSSVLILMLFAGDQAFRGKLRASVRHALWLVVLVKLCVPPTLALPTSPVWWLHKSPAPLIQIGPRHYTVTYDQNPLSENLPGSAPKLPSPGPVMTMAAGLLLASAATSLALLAWLLARWAQITWRVRRAAISGRLNQLADETGSLAGVRFAIPVKVTGDAMSPAVCGLFHPVILVPRPLLETFSDEQLRAVLLHELIHLRRRDVWVNFWQALLQIVYWWHPLVWLANTRIRQVREEAVDDAVVLALREEAEGYAPTLLAVAKLALNRPLASLGLVGILESRHGLGRRIERLLDGRGPRPAGLTLVSCLGILAFAAVAVPMGAAPASPEASLAADDLHTITMKVDPEVFIRNVKAQARNLMHGETDDYTGILLDVLAGEGVDCHPPHGLAFNTKTGEITSQNTTESLEIFRRVIEQLNRADGRCALPLGFTPFHRPAVLITGQFYMMSAADTRLTTRLLESTGFQKQGQAGTLTPDHFAAFQKQLKTMGLSPFARPRIQTGHGIPARLAIGDAIHVLQFSCRPLVIAGGVQLSFQGNVVGDPLADGTVFGTASWQVAGNVGVRDKGGMVVFANNPHGSMSNHLVGIIGVQLVTNNAPVKPSPTVQLHIKARFIEVPPGTTESFEKYSIATNKDQSKLVGLLPANTWPAILHELERQHGVENLAEPEVTTSSGRQTQMRATRTVEIITGSKYAAPSDHQTNSIVFDTQHVEIGPILDSLGYVLPDDHTIRLKATASLTDFLGYDEVPTNVVGKYIPEIDGHLPVFLPSFSARHAAVSINLYDGQTVVLGNLLDKHYYDGDQEVDREPAYFVRTKKSRGQVDKEQEELLVFITVALVDEAGNRIHEDAHAPFAQDGVPPQP